MTARARALSLAAGLALAACSSPALLPELEVAEQHERAGRHELALSAYERALETCGDIEARRRRRETCAAAYLGRAELLVTLERDEEAARAYEAIPGKLENDPAASAHATYRAGEIHLQAGRERRGYELLWKTVTDYPNEAHAGDALKVLLRDGRRRDPRQLYGALRGLLSPLSETEVADNLLYAMAKLAEEDVGDRAAARELYDRIARDHEESGLFDDALWHGARLSRALGDGAGAARRLRDLLATREVAFGAGSYFSVWLDDAQLELGRVLRDDLGDHEGAIAALRELPEDYPDSILHDDALWERAVTWQRAGRKERACDVLATLARRHPDSKYELERAPSLRETLACPADAL